MQVQVPEGTSEPHTGADNSEVDTHEDPAYRNTDPGRARVRGKNSRGRRGRRPGGKESTEPVVISDPRTIIYARDEYVDIRPLKNFARNHLSPNSSLYEVLIFEPDELEATAFLAKTAIWLLLLGREDR